MVWTSITMLVLKSNTKILCSMNNVFVIPPILTISGAKEGWSRVCCSLYLKNKFNGRYFFYVAQYINTSLSKSSMCQALMFVSSLLKLQLVAVIHV